MKVHCGYPDCDWKQEVEMRDMYFVIGALHNLDVVYLNHLTDVHGVPGMIRR